MNEGEELSAGDDQRGLDLQALLDESLDLDVSAGLDLEGAPLRIRREAPRQGALDVVGPGVMAFDQVGVVGVDGAHQVDHGASGDRVKLAAKGAGFANHGERRLLERARLRKQRLHRRRVDHWRHWPILRPISYSVKSL